ncbi:MAG: DUF3883 domain-containing protein, partial [Desulfuromonadaceae bacterium]
TVFDDYRAARGVGADAVQTREELKRFFELKASANPIGDRASLTAAEYERAVRERGNFWLALVGNLSNNGAPIEVVLIQDPAARLKLAASDDIILSGVSQITSTRCVIGHTQETNESAPGAEVV